MLLDVRNDSSRSTELHHQASFLSRGVAAPFTTQMLAGARVRESGQSGIELVVFNPSGGSGVYILGWPGVLALCNPTVHDTVLYQRLGSLAVIDPAHIRHAAWAVAAEGYAGRAAASAASTAMANDHSERQRAHLRLLGRVLSHHQGFGLGFADPADSTPDRALVVRQLALSLGRQAAELAIDLTEIANVFAPVGIARDDRDARIPRLIACLENTSIAMLVWLDTDIGNELAGLGRALAQAILMAAGTAGALLQATRAALTDPPTLLKRWVSNPAAVTAVASRCDWVLDGWERVCLLWAIASSDAARRAALLEMATLMPTLPREAQEWTDVTIPVQAMEENCRVTSGHDAWRGGSAAFRWTERNEQLRTLAI